MTAAPVPARLDPTPLRARPLPDHRPPVMGETTDGAPTADACPYVQGTLAVDFALREARPDASTRPAGLPDPRSHGAALVQAILEIMAGSRAAPQALRWTSPDVYVSLVRRAAVAGRRRGARTVPSPRRQVVRRVRVCEPQPGVAEVAAVVADGTRVRAVALRLEATDSRWRVTALQVG